MKIGMVSKLADAACLHDDTPSGDQLSSLGILFDRDDAPPLLPVDPYFCLASTTLHFEHNVCSADHISNRLLVFLRKNANVADAEILITKVNRKKCSVSADVKIEELECSLKMRMYQTIAGWYCLEFQRRSGGALAFQRIYNLASKDIQQTTSR